MNGKSAATLRERMGGRQPQRIYQLDNSFKTILIDAQWTAEDICEKIAEKLGFHTSETDASYFALYSAENGITGEGVLFNLVLAPETAILIRACFSGRSSQER
jgi:hypothetical protein